MANTEEKSFEEALKELEAVVRDMEGGNLPLDELLAGFEKGVGLLRYCEKKLGEAEGKIAVLTQSDIQSGVSAEEQADEDLVEQFEGESLF